MNLQKEIKELYERSLFYSGDVREKKRQAERDALVEKCDSKGLTHEEKVAYLCHVQGHGWNPFKEKEWMLDSYPPDVVDLIRSAWKKMNG